MSEETIQPVPVHVANLHELASRPAGKCHRNVTFRTFQLTAANPVKPICAADVSREMIIVQAFTNDVVLCESQSKAEDPANSATANPGFPEGYLVPKANTTPTYLPTTDLIWATAGTFPAQLTVALINRVP